MMKKRFSDRKTSVPTAFPTLLRRVQDNADTLSIRVAKLKVDQNDISVYEEDGNALPDQEVSARYAEYKRNQRKAKLRRAMNQKLMKYIDAEMAEKPEDEEKSEDELAKGYLLNQMDAYHAER